MRRLSKEQYKIDLKDYQKGRRINSGAFGIVYHVTHKKTGKMYVAKKINCGDDPEQCEKLIDREVLIMMSISHPTLAKLIGYSKVDFQEENNIVLIMELATNGSLLDVIKKIELSDGPHEYTNTSRQIILIGIARGMKYLHDRYIIHRDLKAGNILLDENFYPLITDFGMAKFLDVGHTKSQSQYGGTLPYMAPEIHKGDPYGPKADVYSFAILMYEVLTDSLAFPELLNGLLSDFNFRNKVVNENYRPKFNIPIKKSLKNLIERCWSADPNSRPNFGEIFDKLSNRDESEDCFIDDVDVVEIKNYVEDITEILDPIEKVISTNEEEIQKLRDDKKQLISEKEKIKKELDIEKRIHVKALNIFKSDDNIRRSPVDVLFVIDVTKSNFQLVNDTVSDLMIDFRMNYRNNILSFSSIICSESGHLLISNFFDEDEKMSEYLESVGQLPETYSITSCDYASLLICAYSKLSCRRSRIKTIICIGSRPAKGKRFCGEEGNENEEEELTYLLKKLSHEDYHFYCLYFNELAKNSFTEMCSIYEECFNPFSFVYHIDDAESIITEESVSRVTIPSKMLNIINDE